MIDLWVRCFGDSYEVAREFFALGGVETLSEKIDGELAGMASLIPVSDSLGGRGYYLYGVCVADEYRGRGIFKRLMSRCEQKAINEGADYLCLIPVNRSIAEAYLRMGYSIPVALCTDTDCSSVRIFSDSVDFSEFALSDEDFFGADCGMLKPISKSVDTNMSFSFPNRMGEC